MNVFDLLNVNLQFFAADGGAGAGASGGTGEGGEGNQGSGTNPGGQGTNEGNGGTGDGTPPEGDKTFTQEDVNNIAAKEARKAKEQFLKELGIEDFENAKEGMKKFQEWQDAQKTDAEKQAEKLTNLEKTHAETQAENETLKAQISAVKAGVKTDSVEDVVTLAKNLVGDNVDMDAAIKQVMEKYPHFAAEEQTEGQPPKFSTGTHSKKTGEDSFANILLGK